MTMDAIHIMKPGSHTSSDGTVFKFSPADLKECAEAYNPRVHEAPLVVGHPKTNGPAYGWVERLEAKPDGLYAVPRQINPEFADIVRQGSYKKISGAFYLKDAKNHPSPGNLYLRHVGFLGAAAPAVKGLEPINFSDSAENFLEFEESTLDLREFRLQSREREIRQQDNQRFAEDMVLKGTLPIGLKSEVMTFMEALSDDGTIEFDDGDGKTTNIGQLQWFKRYLSLLPKPVMTGEFCQNEFSDEGPEFAAPQNYSVDPEKAKIHRIVVAYQNKNNVPYADAVRAVVAQGLADI
jgi:hypothetical protein